MYFASVSAQLRAYHDPPTPALGADGPDRSAPPRPDSKPRFQPNWQQAYRALIAASITFFFASIFLKKEVDVNHQEDTVRRWHRQSAHTEYGTLAWFPPACSFHSQSMPSTPTAQHSTAQHSYTAPLPPPSAPLPLPHYPQPHSPTSHWSHSQTLVNWSGTHSVRVRSVDEPETHEDLERRVQRAHERGCKIRPSGSHLSPNGLSFQVI